MNVTFNEGSSTWYSEQIAFGKASIEILYAIHSKSDLWLVSSAVAASTNGPTISTFSCVLYLKLRIPVANVNHVDVPKNIRIHFIIYRKRFLIPWEAIEVVAYVDVGL